ncbi:uncharacterized protein LOC106408917 [Brassica napus]|uniref:uncharacterized protein LOC106408917 n=1 Tax=Brassica napus TaxID=3708 RepID=UPI0006AAABC0|nr:uncharacterized protein LOC106408917 [Brassica napus]
MNIEKVFESISLEEEEVPFNLPDLPQFSAVERNKMSIMGRTLNPESQNISDLILDMPRKWQIYDRVKGIVLSKTTFQFVFKFEHDLEEVMRKRVWTFNEWSIVIDRWVEKPPEDYLKYLLVWVHIRNIPVNHCTAEAIEAFGDLIGRVDVVAFDPNKAQSHDYVRVRVFFDVSRPVRKEKVINLPGGGSVTLRYDFERIQKRCYHCQRLTHEKDKCPLLIQARREQSDARRQRVVAAKQSSEHCIQKNDPLYGVLSDDQVGIDRATGRSKINPDVLQNMREYILAADGGEKRVREERVRQSILDLEKNPRGQKEFLRLEPAPVVILDVNREKGLIFDYSGKDCEKAREEKEGSRTSDVSRGNFNSNGKDQIFSTPSGSIECSTGFSAGYTVASSSGTSRSKGGGRRRPPRRQRTFKSKPTGSANIGVEGEEDTQENMATKRRAEEVAGNYAKIARRTNSEVVPNGGLPDQ